MRSKFLIGAFSWLVAILVPLAVIMLVVRVLMTPVFSEIEYRMPGFPEDSYGFSMQDRLLWSKPSIEFLLNNDGIEYLANLKFSDGQPIYNERELSHMDDVKRVVQLFLKAWYLDLAALVIFFFLAWQGGWVNEYILGWKRGGFLTVALVVGIGLFATTSFWQFFSWFHSLFFSGDTWLFSYSDTLIRLFPIRFWEDIVLYIGGLSIIAGLGLGFGLKPEYK